MNKKQPFYKTGSPLNQFPDPIQLLRTKFGGKSNQGDLNNSTSSRGALSSHRYHNTPATSSFGERVSNTINNLFNLDKGEVGLKKNNSPENSGDDSKSNTTPVIPQVPTSGTTPGTPSSNGGKTKKDEEFMVTQPKDEGSGGGGGLNTSFMKDWGKNIREMPLGDPNIGSDLGPENSAKGILTRHGGSITRDGKLIKTYDSDVSASGKAGRKARRQMKKDDKAAGLTRPERRERKLMAKAMASQRAAGLGFEAGDNMSAEIGKSGQAMLSPSQSHFTTEREAGLDYGGKARKKGMRLINKTNNFISRQRSQTSQGSALDPGIREQYSESQSLSDKVNSRPINPVNGLTNQTFEISKQGKKIQDKINAGSSYKPGQGDSIEKTVSKIVNDNKKDKKGIQLPGTGISRGSLESGAPLNQIGSAVSKGDKSLGKQVAQKQAFYKTGTPFHNHTPGDQGVKHEQMVDGNDVGGNDSTTYDSKGSGYGMNNEAVTSDARFKDKKLSDFAMNSPERRDYYTARGMAQDYTTELPSDNTNVVEKPEEVTPVVEKVVKPEEVTPVVNSGGNGDEVKKEPITEGDISGLKEKKGLSTKNKGGGGMGLISETQEGVFFKKGPINTLKKIVRR